MRSAGVRSEREAVDQQVAAIVLAAGRGDRLQPLTWERPKPLCPVGATALVDHAIARVRSVTSAICVNIHFGRDQMEQHFAEGGASEATSPSGAAADVPVAPVAPVHLSIEAERALGTAGALGHIRDWIDGRGLLVVNSDAWTPASVGDLLDGWDGERIRLLIQGDGAFTPQSRVAGALMPWRDVSSLDAEPSGLYERSWRGAHAAGRLETVGFDEPFIDCGTPARYLAANLLHSGGMSVLDPTADVAAGATIGESVVWGNARVDADENLVRAIRTTHGRTVLIR